MTKQDILRAYVGNCIWEDTIDSFSIDNTDSNTICRAMQTYADQETTSLKNRIAKLESELQMLQDYLIKEGK